MVFRQTPSPTCPLLRTPPPVTRGVSSGLEPVSSHVLIPAPRRAEHPHTIQSAMTPFGHHPSHWTTSTILMDRCVMVPKGAITCLHHAHHPFRQAPARTIRTLVTHVDRLQSRGAQRTSRCVVLVQNVEQTLDERNTCSFHPNMTVGGGAACAQTYARWHTLLMFVATHARETMCT